MTPARAVDPAQVLRTIGPTRLGEQLLRPLLAVFQVPGPAYAVLLVRAVGRIAESVSWLDDALGFAELRPGIAELERELVRAYGHQPGEAAELTGDFVFARSLVGQEPAPAPGPESLRASLLVCCLRWLEEGVPRMTSSSELLGSVIRGVTERHKRSGPSAEVRAHLSTLGDAGDLTSFITASQVIHTFDDPRLSTAWRQHFGPTLERVNQRAVTETRARRRPNTRSPAGGTYLEDHYNPPPPAIRVRSPSPDAERQPYEPLEETATTAFLGVLPGPRANPDARNVSRYVAQQAIWSENYLLVTQHPSVLPTAQFQQVLRILLEQLQDDATPTNLTLGLAGLLLQAITGRGSRLLLGMVDDDPDGGSPRPCRLSLTDRHLDVAVVWRIRPDRGDGAPGFFVPSPSTAHLFEPVARGFRLPLAPSVAKALSRGQAMRALSTANLPALDDQLRAAARHVSGIAGFTLTPGQVRRSFSAHLYESCRDLAMTQLISGDSLGQSEASLHYYSPRRCDVAQAYSLLLSELLELDAKLTAGSEDSTRVGASSLVLQRRAKRLAAVSGATLNAGVDAGRWRDIHQAMVTHLACMFMGIAGHRPVEALFELTTADLHWHRDGGIALFRDKRHDPAHDPRLAAFPPCVAQQIEAYLAHLQGVALIEPALAQHVGSVLDGHAPMLFGVNAANSATRLRLAELRRALPSEWEQVPLNWGRTWIRTRAVEAGLPPEWAAVQLGHLEGVGYPFSNASPTIPAAAVSAIAPHLESMARQLGWRVRAGVPCPKPRAELPVPELGHWGRRIAEHEDRMRKQVALARKMRQSSLKAYRERANTEVLKHPVLCRRGLDKVFQHPMGPWSATPLSRLEAETLRDTLVESAGDDVPLAIAYARALRRILRVVNTRLGAPGQEPAPIGHFRRPVDNAFVPRMMHAVRQIEALRAHAAVLGAQPPGNTEDFYRASARVAYVLAVFGFVDDHEQILGAITHRASLEAPARLSDTILVPWGEHPGQLLAMRNLAAICFARFARKHAASPAAPDPAALDTALAELLPAWAGCQDERDILAKLCETVGVANRYELSPAARFALDRTAGAVNATMADQLALIDGDPVGTVKRIAVEPDDAASPGEGELPTGGTGNARAQYLELCRLLPREGKALVLRRTGERIAAEQLIHAKTRKAVVAEVTALLADQGPTTTLHPVVRMLATWVRHMLTEGTPGTTAPSDRTIATYLTRIGGTLVEVLGSGSLEALDDVELEDAYLAAVLAGPSNRAQAAAAVLAFDACTRRYFDLPDADLSEVRAYTSTSTRAVDAELVLPVERLAMIERVAQRAAAADAPDLHGARLLRQAAAALPLYAWSGARRGEILGVRARDVWMHDGAAAVMLRKNRSRRLKTRAGHRTLILDAELPGLGGAYSWVKSDSRRSPEWQRPRSYLFSPLARPDGADGRDAIAAACMEVMREVTERRRERLHRLRHLVAFERTLPIVLSEEDLAWMRSSGLRVTPPHGDHPALPRDLMERIVPLGHRDWRTTIQSYLHLPWLWRSASDERVAARHLSRREVAFAMGVTLPAVDKITQKNGRVSPRCAWLQHVRRPRRLREAVDERTWPTESRMHTWTATELDSLFKRVERIGSLEDAVRVAGGSAADYSNIATLVRVIERRIGGRLFRPAGRDRPTEGPGRVVRRLDASLRSQLLAWLDTSMRDRDPEVEALIQAIADAMNHQDRAFLLGDTSVIHRLVAEVFRLTDARVTADVTPVENGWVKATFRSEAGTPLVGDVKAAIGAAWIALQLRAKRELG